MEKFDAFASGIDFGGLRNMFDIKILVCYILKSVKTPMTRTQICDAMQKTGLVNFFDANSAIDELLKTGTILVPPLNAASSVLLNRRSLSGVLIIHPPTA